MQIIDWVLLAGLVIVGVFVSSWLVPFIVVLINRLLLQEVNPFLILVFCMLAAVIGDVLLWYFDQHIHSWFDKKLKIKKPQTVLKHKKGVARKVSHRLREKMQMVNNKFVLFLSVFFASFSIVPDLFIVEFSRQKMKIPSFVPAMFMGKTMVYAPLIWGSIGFIQLFHTYF